MFTGSHGSLWRRVHAATFASKAKLKRAVVECLELPPKGDCTNGPNGAIGEWDVSGVTDMDEIFDDASSFNGDISKWDV